MYIAPNTTLYILKNIPLGKDYENTVYYPDAASQAAAFMKYSKFQLNNYSYQRAQLGTIRVELKYEQLYDCNYLMFKNTNFENKWFYAFITGVSYINNDVSEIYYEMDVMQTWCYDYKFLDSFVERRHATYDHIFDNSVPEGLDLGAFYRRRQYFDIHLTVYFCLLATELTTAALPAGVSFKRGLIEGGTANPVVSAIWFITTTQPNTTGPMLEVINQYNNEGKGDAIVAFYTAPSQTFGSTQQSFTFNLNEAGSHAIRNYKLFTSPYQKVQISNHQGVTLEIPMEAISANSEVNCTMQTKLENDGYPNGQSRLVITGINIDASELEESISYTNFQTCAFATDSFKTWWAQNKNNYIATLNSIERTYDTNQQIAQNQYSIAQRSAQAGAAQSRNSANAQLANATAANNASLAAAQRSFNTGEANRIAQGSTGIIGNLLGLNIGGAISAGVNALAAQNTAQTDLANTQAGLAVSQANAQNSAGAILANSQIAMSAAMKNAAEGLASAQLSGLTAKQNATEQLMSKVEDMHNMPPAAKGNAMCDSLNAVSGNIGYTIARLGLTNGYMQKLDHYFDIYGYKQACLFKGSKLNTRINRKHWSFLKTVGANIRGNFNAADLQTIRGIYDNGITTWDNLEDVGNYELDNTIDDHSIPSGESETGFRI